MSLQHVFSGLSPATLGASVLQRSATLRVYEGYGVSDATNLLHTGDYSIDQADDIYRVDQDTIGVNASSIVKRMVKKVSASSILFPGQHRFADSFNDSIYSDKWQANDQQWAETSATLTVTGPKKHSTIILTDPAIWDDFVAEFRVRASHDQGKVGLLFRTNGEITSAPGVSADTTGYACVANFTSNTLSFNRFDAGRSVGLQSSSYAFTTGTDYLIRVIARSGRLYGLVETSIAAGPSLVLNTNDAKYRNGSLGFIATQGATVGLQYTFRHFEAYGLKDFQTIDDLLHKIPHTAGVTAAITPLTYAPANHDATQWSTFEEGDPAEVTHTSEYIQYTAGGSNAYQHSDLFTVGRTFNNFFLTFDIQGTSVSGTQINRFHMALGPTPTMRKMIYFFLGYDGSAGQQSAGRITQTGTSIYRNDKRSIDVTLDNGLWYPVRLLKKDDWMAATVGGIPLVAASDVGVSALEGVSPRTIITDINTPGASLYNHFMVGLATNLAEGATTPSVRMRNFQFHEFADDVVDFSIQPNTTFLNALERVFERNTILMRTTGSSLNLFEQPMMSFNINEPWTFTAGSGGPSNFSGFTGVSQIDGDNAIAFTGASTSTATGPLASLVQTMNFIPGGSRNNSIRLWIGGGGMTTINTFFLRLGTNAASDSSGFAARINMAPLFVGPTYYTFLLSDFTLGSSFAGWHTIRRPSLQYFGVTIPGAKIIFDDLKLLRERTEPEKTPLLEFLSHGVSLVPKDTWHGISQPTYSLNRTQSDDQSVNKVTLIGKDGSSFDAYDLEESAIIPTERLAVISDETVDTRQEAAATVSAYFQQTRRRDSQVLSVPAQPHWQPFDVINLQYPWAGVSGNYRITRLDRTMSSQEYTSSTELLKL